MRAILRRLGTRTGISASLVIVIAAIVIVARLAGGGGAAPGSFAQPDPGLPSVGPSAGDDGQVAVSTSAPTDNAEVGAAATRFMDAWLRQDLEPTAWHDGLVPHVTASVAQSLNGVDPVTVPATRISGALTVSLRSELYALVSVPVDTGVVELGLLKQADRWLVDSVDWQRT